MGASREKIILGIPTHGRAFTIDRRNNINPPGVVFTGIGNPGPLTKEGGMLGYQEICLNMMDMLQTNIVFNNILII